MIAPRTKASPLPSLVAVEPHPQADANTIVRRRPPNTLKGFLASRTPQEQRECQADIPEDSRCWGVGGVGMSGTGPLRRGMRVPPDWHRSAAGQPGLGGGALLELQDMLSGTGSEDVSEQRKST
jgi:hypothetical protein